ncbi:hypothetical protein CSB45_13655 [candidate division KSB3 bacterium]|uniref:Uncharacterized protein n=1 Tax=candidate division KSB3 bacterium TaxID=2044937 RepID=A0A2G6E1Q3_9BACT|nr:MAG: hypothetical protein CSB45_13655 [candidate division KSB3 bacterium]PIE28605.1 MAG: hypothetical protein CSA57_13305 [candidate division KSB3 bacterium]
MSKHTGLRKNIRAALLAAFPSKESFEEFEHDDRNISAVAVPHILQYAYVNGLIQRKKREDLLNFFTRRQHKDTAIPSEDLDLTFDKVMEDVLHLYGKSMNSLLTLLNKDADALGMPHVQGSMLARLKQQFSDKTVKKRIALRLLAFWITKHYPQLGWNYERLRSLPHSVLPAIQQKQEQEGVVVSFTVQGRGAIIETESIQWMKAELENCLKDLHAQKLRDYHAARRNIASIGVASVTLKLPKKTGPSGEPKLYTHAIRDSLALAHQMAARWLLSEYSNTRKVLLVVIFAGQYSEANIFLPVLQDFHLTTEPHVLLTSFAYQCARVADMKVKFNSPPQRVELGRELITNVWMLDYFWSHPYFDFIPVLLKEEMLPTHSQSYRQFREELRFPGKYPQESYQAIRAIRKVPQNTLLLMEIVKVLMARQMFHEANAILADIFITHPQHLLARVSRLYIYVHLAMEQKDFSSSELMFERALAEGAYLTGYCTDETEVWCMYGLVYFERALKYWAILRKSQGKENRKVNRGKIFEFLELAEEKFSKGMLVSPMTKDNRAIFLLLYNSCLQELLEHNEEFLSQLDFLNFEDPHNVYTNVILRYLSLIGWVRENFSQSPDADSMTRLSEKTYREIVKLIVSELGTKMFQHAVLLRSYIPNNQYSYCCLLWDFAPKLTIGLGKYILTTLQEARDNALALTNEHINIFALAPQFPVNPEKFAHFMEYVMERVNALIPAYEWQKDDEEFFDDETQATISRVKLGLLYHSMES